MHIGYDISQTGKAKAGCGYFAHAMITALFNIAPEHTYSIYPNFGNFYFDYSMPFKNPFSQGRYGPRHFRRSTAQRFWQSDNLEAKLNNPEIIHANNYWCPAHLKSTRLIYTLYDISFAINPNWTTERNRQCCFEGVLRAALYADGILAISESTRSSYLALFPHFPVDRIKVIYPSSRYRDSSLKGEKPHILKEHQIEPNHFWLSVGTIEPRKNQRQLTQAYARYCSLSKNPKPLILAGGKGWMMNDFQKSLKDLGIEKNVILTNYVTDEELAWLYGNCYGNLYASFYEGFGLPVLEGMQFGAPILASNSSSIPEVTGEAGILLAPNDIDAWAHAMLELEGSQEAHFRWKEKALKRSREFNWEKSALEVLQFYNEIKNLPKRNSLNN